MIKAITSIFFICAFSSTFYGQRFESINDDYPIARANCIYQDDFGFIWFGTRDGLVKYDGISPTYYRQDLNDPFSLPGPEVLSILQVSDSILYIGLAVNGLVKFNRNTGKSYPLNITNELSNSNVYSLIKDKKDNIWIGTNLGLFRYGNEEIIHYKNENSNGYGIIDDQITKVFEDIEGNIWIASDGGIHKFTYSKNQIENPNINPNFPDQRILDINMDREHNIWISVTDSNYKLYKWDIEKKSFIPDFRHKGFGRYRFTFNQKNELWVSSDREGVFKFGDSSFVHFAPDNYLEHGLRSLFTQTIFQDKYQNIWMHGDDIYKISGRHKNFKWITTDGFQVSGLHADEDYIWYCSREPMRRSKVNSSSKSLFDDKSGQSLGDSDVNRMYHFEESGDSLIYTSINDIYIWDRKDDTVDKFSTNLEGAFRDFIIREDGKLLIADNSDQIMIFDPKTHSLHPHKILSQIKYPISVAQSKDRTQWWGTSQNGLFMHNPKSGQIKQFTADNDNPNNSLSSQNINDVTSHSNGTVWVGTKSGLDKIEPLSGKITQIKHEPHLQRTYISSILEDDNGNLWMGSQNGLIFFDQSRDFVKRYTKDDGLLNTIYTPRACNKDEDGYLYFGGMEGIDYFHPDEINENLIAPDIYIKSLKVNGQDHLTDIAGENIRTITLRHQDQYFEIELVGLHMNSTNGNTYSYKLEPLINKWVETGINRTISFGKLPSGNYSFLAKCANPDGIWAEPKVLLTIKVRPPYWLTYWFITLMILAMLGSVYGVYIFRITAIKKRESLKTKFNKQIAEMEMKTLRAQMNPHFLFNALNSIKLLVANSESEKARKYITKFSELIRQVLDNSRKKIVRLDDELRTIENYLQLEQMRFKNFSYEINIDESIPLDFIDLPPLLIQPFVENAIWHGLMNKQKGDKNLKINISRDSDKILIIIEDNGIGRKQAQLLKSRNKKKTSSLGIQLSQNRVKVFNDLYDKKLSIQFMDLENPTGTQVIIILPGHE